MTGGLARRQQASVTRAWGRKRALLLCNLHRLSVRIGIKGRVLASSSQTRQELSDHPCEIPKPHVCSRYHGHGYGKRSGQLDAEARSSFVNMSLPLVLDFQNRMIDDGRFALIYGGLFWSACNSARRRAMHQPAASPMPGENVGTDAVRG